MSNGDSPIAMPCRAAVNPPAQHSAAPTPQATPMTVLFEPGAARFHLEARLSSRRLAAGEKFTHAVECLEDVLGRVGVGQPHISLAQNAEVRAADDGDA